MTDSKWIQFVLADTQGVKTSRWNVITRDGQRIILGMIRWHGAWRGYAFFPEPNTLFEPTCLQDIATFIREQMALRKEGPTHSNGDSVTKKADVEMGDKLIDWAEGTPPEDVTVTPPIHPKPDVPRPFMCGDVVALGLRDGSCPIGFITATDATFLRLDLMSFLDGSFGCKTEIVRHDDIQRGLSARLLSVDEAMHRDGWDLYSGHADKERTRRIASKQKVFDTDALADFQAGWLRRCGHSTPIEGCDDKHCKYLFEGGTKGMLRRWKKR